MEPFEKHTGIAALLDRMNVDTDQIIPKQFLKKVERTGYGVHLFQDWRYLEDGSDNPDFELNHPKFKGASILVSGENFGCGSSREHAPWAIRDYGFRVIIASSYADIFYNNCFKNGILPIKIEVEALSSVVDEIKATPGTTITVDLENQQFTTQGGIVVPFAIDPSRKEFLLKGLDTIAWTLQFEENIQRFEARQQKEFPWLWKLA